MSDVPITYQGNLCPRFFRVLNHKVEDAGPPYRTIVCAAIDIPRTLKPSEKKLVRCILAGAHPWSSIRADRREAGALSRRTRNLHCGALGSTPCRCE